MGHSRHLRPAAATNAANSAAWAGSVDVYAYFNNDWEGFAVENGLSLMRRLRRSPGG